MIRGTTPTFVLTIQDEHIDLSEADGVYVTIRQPDVTITKTGEDITIDENTVECYLTQRESLELIPEKITEIQVNWTYTDSYGATMRAATVAKQINIREQLLPEVLT